MTKIPHKARSVSEAYWSRVLANASGWYPAISGLWKYCLADVGNSRPTDTSQQGRPGRGFFARHVDTLSPISRHSADTFSQG